MHLEQKINLFLHVCWKHSLYLSLRVHKSEVPWCGALNKSSRRLRSCPNKSKVRSGEVRVVLDGWSKNISRTFVTTSPHRFCPFGVSDPPADGQGRVWIADGNGSSHFKWSTRKEPRFKFDYIWITETRSKNLLPHTSCLSDLLPQIPKSLSECKLQSSGPVRSDRV